MEMKSEEPINVLCLHGCNQTQEMYQGLLKDFNKIAMQNGMKLYFIEGKYNHPDGGKTWYNRPLIVPDIGKIKYENDLVQDTMDYLHQRIQQDNISILLGFSQGANVIDTYLRYSKYAEISSIKCIVLLSGYSLNGNEKPILNIPILNIVSEQDQIVPCHLLPTGYSNSQVIKHEKGHKLPTSKPLVRNIIKWMKTNSHNNK